jgi:GT2 family glycosyltransferase
MPIDDASYREWIDRFDTLSSGDLEAAARYARTLPHAPALDVILPVYDPPEAFLAEAIRSVRSQVYEKWTLAIVDDGSTAPHVRRLLEGAAREDARITVHHSKTNCGIARATNAAIALGQNEFVVFFDHDDVLSPHALLMVADRLRRSPDANLIYSDFDFIDDQGHRTNPFFKPDYDYDYHLGQNLVSQLTVFRRSLLDELRGMCAEFGGSTDYDLSLRAVEAIEGRTIVHIPHVLYHWRMVPTSSSRKGIHQAIRLARKAVEEHCTRRSIVATVGGTPRSLIWNRVRATPRSSMPVTVVVRGASAGARREAAARLADGTDYRDLSFRDPGAALASSEAALRNEVLRDSASEIVAFVDARIVPRDASWLGEMTSHFAYESCGVVGARTISPDGRVEQSGILLGVGDGTGMLAVSGAFAGVPDGDANYFGRAEMAHRVSAVSGGIFVVRRRALLDVGGFDDGMANAVALDIDACLRLREGRWHAVLCPLAVFDGRTPAPRLSVDGDSATRLKESWGSLLEVDPYYNPNLSAVSPDFGLAFPPRARFPW